METHWEKRTLANTQEKARQESTGEVVSSSGQGRYKTPKGHADREVCGGFPEVVEEHVPIRLWCKSQQRSEAGHEQKAYEGTCMVIYPT